MSFQEHAIDDNLAEKEDEFGGFGIVINGHSLVNIILCEGFEIFLCVVGAFTIIINNHYNIY